MMRLYVRMFECVVCVCPSNIQVGRCGDVREVNINMCPLVVQIEHGNRQSKAISDTVCVCYPSPRFPPIQNVHPLQHYPYYYCEEFVILLFFLFLSSWCMCVCMVRSSALRECVWVCVLSGSHTLLDVRRVPVSLLYSNSTKYTIPRHTTYCTVLYVCTLFDCIHWIIWMEYIPAGSTEIQRITKTMCCKHSVCVCVLCDVCSVLILNEWIIKKIYIYYTSKWLRQPILKPISFRYNWYRTAKTEDKNKKKKPNRWHT